MGALVVALACALSGVLASAADAAGGPTWLSQTELSSTGPVSDVQVAMDNQGDALAAWIDSAGAVDFSFRPAGGGSSFSSPTEITGTGVAPSDLHLAMDQSGNAVAVWDENNQTVWAASFSPSDPTTFNSPVDIAGTAGNPATSPAAAIYNENGSGFAPNAEIVWLDNDSGAHEIVQGLYFDLFQACSPACTVENLTDDTEANAADPQVVLDSAGNAIAAWEQSDGSHTQIWSEVKPGSQFGTFPGSGSRSQLSSGSVDAADIRLGSDRFDGNLPNAGGVSAVWDDSGGHVDAAYMPLGNTNWNTAQTGIGTGTLPAVAIDSLGNAVAVWQDSGLIEAAGLEAGGSQQFGTSVQVSKTGDSSSAAQVATNGNGESIAAWQDATAGDIEAAVQTSFNLTPVFGSAAPISSAGNSPASPVVALDTFGDAVAGWQQGATAQPQVAGYDNGPQFQSLQIPNAPYAGHPVTFSADVSDVWSNLPGASFAWDFGDGVNTTGNPVSHAYSSTGPETATLTVTDTAGVQAPVQSQGLTVGTRPAAVPGGLFQLDSPNDCFTGASWGCGRVQTADPTSFAYQPAVSPDGKNVYFASLFNSVTEFSRDPSTGALTYMGCLSASGVGGGCTQVPNSGMNQPAGVVVSPDGNDVYVIGQSDHAVVELSRNPSTGELTWQHCIGEAGGTCINTAGVGLDTPYGITISSDGKNVYVSSNGNGGELASFDRAADGTLTQTEPPNDCVSGAPSGCGGPNNASGLANAVGVAVSPDGNNIYVEAGGTGAPGDIAEFSRTANGPSFAFSELGCVGTTSPCTGGGAIDGTEDMAISPDGKFAYVNSFANGSVVELSRDATTGALSQIGAVSGGNGLSAPLGVAISPDGANVYVSGAGSNAEAAFTRNPSTGTLTQLASPFDCITDDSSGCGQVGATGLAGARRVTVSPDGKNVYVAGQNSNSIAALSRAPGGADLALSVSGAPATATSGASFAYTYTITNNGPAAVADPVMTVAPSSKLSSTTAAASQGSCSGGICQLGRIAAGASAVVQVPVMAVSPGIAVTPAAVAPSSEVVDPNNANNSVSSSTTIQAPTTNTIPAPVVHKTANALPVAGKVYVRLPGSKKFILISKATQLPMGTVIDARHGTVELVFAKKGGGTMEGQYFDGEFYFEQGRNYVVTVFLYGSNLKSCKRTKKHAPIAVIARRRGRSLWSNVHGSFTTTGRSASGSVRGTEWLTVDSCAGTRITVTRDKVLVTNLRTHKKKIIKAGHTIFIKA